MAYAEWIAVKVVVSKSIGTVGIRNATLQWGKFYRYTNKDDEISTEEVSSMNVQAGSPQWIASCGRENASSGTQGSFDCYDGNTKMGTFSWDDPWKSGAIPDPLHYRLATSHHRLPDLVGGGRGGQALRRFSPLGAFMPNASRRSVVGGGRKRMRANRPRR